MRITLPRVLSSPRLLRLAITIGAVAMTAVAPPGSAWAQRSPTPTPTATAQKNATKPQPTPTATATAMPEVAVPTPAASPTRTPSEARATATPTATAEAAVTAASATAAVTATAELPAAACPAEAPAPSPTATATATARRQRGEPGPQPVECTTAVEEVAPPNDEAPFAAEAAATAEPSDVAEPSAMTEATAVAEPSSAADETADRRREALEAFASRIVPSIDFGDYADRLARQNAWLVSPFGEVPLTSAMIRFGYLGDYGEELAFEIRGEEGVAQLGTLHYGLDLQIPGMPEGGRGMPVVAPFDGTVIRTADPHGGPFGIWLESRQLDLRARIMHMDGLVIGIETGVYVRAGEQLGILGAQGTEGFPHLHLAFERLSDGAKINPALFYRLRDRTDPDTFANAWYDDPAMAPAVALRPRVNPPEPRSAASPRPLVTSSDAPTRRPGVGRWGPFALPEL